MLRLTLMANFLSCTLFGIVFLAVPTETAEFLGNPPVWLILVIGAGLILNGVALALEARRKAPRRREVTLFAYGDIIWVLATITLVSTGLWITTAEGSIAASLVALLVGAFGTLQLLFRPPEAAGKE